MWKYYISLPDSMFSLLCPRLCSQWEHSGSKGYFLPSPCTEMFKNRGCGLQKHGMILKSESSFSIINLETKSSSILIHSLTGSKSSIWWCFLKNKNSTWSRALFKEQKFWEVVEMIFKNLIPSSFLAYDITLSIMYVLHCGSELQILIHLILLLQWNQERKKGLSQIVGKKHQLTYGTSFTF